MNLAEMPLDDIIDYICRETLVPEPYVCDQKKKAAYMEAIVGLYNLKLQGKINVTSIDDYDKPYDIHCIYFNWIKDEGGEWEHSAKEIADILKNVDNLNVSPMELVGEWQLSSTFYTPA